MKQIAILLIAVVLSAVSLKFLPFPFIWIFFLWAVVGGVFALMSRKNSIKLVAANLCLALILLAALETMLLVFADQGRKSKPKTRIEGYFQKDLPYLGYGPEPDKRSNIRMLSGDTLIFDVVYTIDANGLRITPQPRATSSEGILFFGCSLTFGAGVNDQDSIPYQVAELTGRRFRVFNFGFYGYGPNQMLSALEHGIVDRIIKDVAPRFIIYQAIPDHVRRSAGHYAWVRASPKYTLSESGDVVYSGTFGISHFLDHAQTSSIGRRLIEFKRRPSQKDVDRLLGIVSRTRDLVAQRWPDAEFYVLLWPGRGALFAPIKDGLIDRGINLRFVSDAIPDIMSNPSQYEIPIDGHPNARAYTMIARYVVNKILKKEQGGANKSR